MDLKLILRGCLARETRYQKLFYRQFYGHALKIAFRYIQQYDQAKCLVNESFIKIFGDDDFFKLDAPDAVVRRSLKKIIVYNAIEKLFFAFASNFNSMNGLTESTTLYLSNLHAEDQDSYLISLLGRLPNWHRIIFNMHVIDGFALSEIAAHFNTSVTSCAFDLDQTRNFLKNLMATEERPLSFVDQELPVAK